MFYPTVAAALALTVAVSHCAHAADGAFMNFSGLVTDGERTVEGAAPGTGAVVKDVNLGGVSAARLAKPGDRANLTGFTIRIGAPGETAAPTVAPPWLHSIPPARH